MNSKSARVIKALHANGLFALVQHIEANAGSIYHDILLNYVSEGEMHHRELRLMGESQMVFVCAGIASLLFGVCQGHNRHWRNIGDLKSHAYLVLRVDVVTETSFEFVDFLFRLLQECRVLELNVVELNFQKAKLRFPELREEAFIEMQAWGHNKFIELEPTEKATTLLDDLLVALGFTLPAVDLCKEQLSLYSKYSTDPNYTHARAMASAIMPKRKHYYKNLECRLVGFSYDSSDAELQSRKWQELLEKEGALKLYEDSDIPAFCGFIFHGPNGFSFCRSTNEDGESQHVDGEFQIQKILDLIRNRPS